MKRMNDSEIIEYANNLCKEEIGDSMVMRKESCKFKSHSPDRYCNATTHDSCYRCRYFEPTIMAKIRTMVERYSELEEENNDLRKKLDRTSEELVIAEETINYYREEIWGEKDGQTTDGKESASNTDCKEDVAGEVGEEG